MNIFSNMTLQEWLKLNSNALELPEGLMSIFEDTVDSITALEKELERANGRIETLEEQNFFATELIDNLEDIVSSRTTAKDIKKAVLTALDDTSFER